MNQDSNAEYWRRFWLEYTSDPAQKDTQTQVLRTRNKVPISADKWAYTLAGVARQLDLSAGDQLLDLCCGNGLFAEFFANIVHEVEAVDLSPQLIARLQERGLPNVRASVGDIREAQFGASRFSKVFWYAGIQYIEERDIVVVIRRIRQWLKPGGILLIGDVPDRQKLWHYFNDAGRETAYFDGLAKAQPIIGTWLDRAWLEKLCVSAGFREAVAIPQDSALIYADFRFDLLARS
jgi:ubiquinone/menaquinone biosynthesis C-methylase UbiE